MLREKYKIMTLCGSTKFKQQFLDMQEKFSMEGYIVLTVGLFAHTDKSPDWFVKFAKQKEMLDDMHKKKIEMSDEVFIIDVDGYIGWSTRNELDHAMKVGKHIRFYSDEIVKG